MWSPFIVPLAKMAVGEKMRHSPRCAGEDMLSKDGSMIVKAQKCVVMSTHVQLDNSRKRLCIKLCRDMFG